MSSIEYIYYAHKIGQEGWTEEIVLTLPQPITEKQVSKLFPLLKRDGYELSSFRESIFNGAPPDFAGTINKRRP